MDLLGFPRPLTRGTNGPMAQIALLELGLGVLCFQHLCGAARDLNR